jgi:hypothetical protein
MPLSERSRSDVALEVVPGSTPERRVKELDGLRALSFLSVFQMHLPGQGGDASFGYAVDVFFVLSTYLIGSRLLAEREATGRIDARRFYRRRRRQIPAFAGFFGNFLVGAQSAAVVRRHHDREPRRAHSGGLILGLASPAWYIARRMRRRLAAHP